MGIDDLLKEFDSSKFLFFALLVLPGFISLRIWSLIVPTADRFLKDEIGEAIAFGILNFAIAGPIFVLWKPSTPSTLYVAIVVVLVVLPALWPFLIKWAINILQHLNLLLIPSKNAWDDVFLRRETYFVIVHLKDGRKIGGYYGEHSYAGVFPNSGHFYLEELWQLDAAGRFRNRIPDSSGIILRPDDYAFIELKRAV